MKLCKQEYIVKYSHDYNVYKGRVKVSCILKVSAAAFVISNQLKSQKQLYTMQWLCVSRQSHALHYFVMSLNTTLRIFPQHLYYYSSWADLAVLYIIFNFLVVSEAPKPAPGSNAPKYSSKVLHEKSDQEKKEELVAAMITKMGDKEDEPLPQDDVDGVDSDEWVSTNTSSVILSI